MIRTGWMPAGGTDAYWERGPYVSPESLELLLCARLAPVGVDFWNIDDTVAEASRRVHTALLARRFSLSSTCATCMSFPRPAFVSTPCRCRLFAVRPSRFGGLPKSPNRSTRLHEGCD